MESEASTDFQLGNSVSIDWIRAGVVADNSKTTVTVQRD
jgi:hypothetical protein